MCCYIIFWIWFLVVINIKRNCCIIPFRDSHISFRDSLQLLDYSSANKVILALLIFIKFSISQIIVFFFTKLWICFLVVVKRNFCWPIIPFCDSDILFRSVILGVLFRDSVYATFFALPFLTNWSLSGFDQVESSSWIQVRIEIKVENMLDLKYVHESKYNTFFWLNFMLSKVKIMNFSSNTAITLDTVSQSTVFAGL